MQGSHAADVGSDQRTVFHAAGSNIQRQNLCAGFESVNFNSAALPEPEASTVRALPDGGVLVANSGVIARLDVTGTVVQIYDAAGEDCWSSLALSGDTKSFWAAGCNSNIYKFELSSGAQILAFSAGPRRSPSRRWRNTGRLPGKGLRASLQNH